MATNDSPINTRAGELIRARRAQYGTPYMHISRKLRTRGIRLTPQMLKRIETGERRSSIDELVAIFEVLDIRMLDLLPFHPIMSHGEDDRG